MNVKRGGSQNVALQSNPVSVPGDHLQNRLQPHQLNPDNGSQTAKTGDRRLIVCYINGIYIILDHLGLLCDHISIAAPRGPTL